MSAIDTLLNASAVETMFRRYHTRLVQFLARRLDGDKDRAADVAQEAYLRLHGVEGDMPHPRALLFRIAQNILTDQFRRDRIRPINPKITLDDIEVAAGEPTPEQVLVGKQDLAALEAAALALPPRCRDVFFMSRFEGMANGEIAKRLGLSLSMVEKHMARAMSELRIAHFGHRHEGETHRMRLGG